MHPYISSLYECDNTSCTRFIWAGETRVATIAASGEVHYWHGDHLGSSSVITDSTGTKAEAITYYPYGATRTDLPGTPVNVPYKYTGQEFDASTGLYDYGARHYDPVLGRLITADTIVPDPANPQDFNRYSYGRNNPLRYTDPTGHHSVESVATYSYATLAFTDRNSDGLLSDLDIHELYGSPFGTPTGNITIEQRDVLLSWMHGISNGLHVGSILNIVSPGGNRTAEFFNELMKFSPTSPQSAALRGYYELQTLAEPWIQPGDLLSFGAGFLQNLGRFAVGKLTARGIANPVPSTLARAIPGKGPFPTLGSPGEASVFVTDAAAIRGMNAAQISKRLGLPVSDGFTVIRFPTPATGLATPIVSNKPGFIGRGLTSGGAPEFVIPNGPIPSGATTTFIR
jgi:RHS repeat-associated protein